MAAMMFNQILITLDGSEYSERALPYGRDLARISGGRVTLLTVIATASAPFHVVDPDTTERLGQRTMAYLEEKAEALREPGIPNVTPHVSFGPPPQMIAELAREHDTDLIVMSTQGLGADDADPRYALGSVALRVLMIAPCPLLMVRINKPEPPRDVAEQRWQWEGGANVG
jgi:nucleotide-binding universal stress UspA family protein